MNLSEVLYPNKNSLLVKPAPQVKTRTTLIERFDGSAFLLFTKNGKLEKRESENLFQAQEEAKRLGLKVEFQKEFGSPLLQKIEEIIRNGK